MYIYVIKKVSLSLSLSRKLKINSVCLSRLFRVLLHGTVTYCLAAHSGSLFLSVYHSLFVSLRKIPKWSGATLQLHILLKSSSGYSYFSFFFFISIFVCPYNSNPFCFTFHFLVKDCVETNYGFWFWSWLGCWENVSFFALNIYVGVTFFCFFCFWYILNKKICVHWIWWCGVIIGLNCTCLIIWLRRICIRLLKFSERRPKFVTILLVMLSSFTCSYFIYESYFYYYIIILLINESTF